MAQFSLSWDEFKTSLCVGLSTLQQNGEFVDMTLAADGHMIKVHQLVMALASTYIKSLITSANCPHPVIYLKRISYETLCAILEYIYTGEVSVTEDRVNEFLEVGKELGIKGLIDTNFETNTSSGQSIQNIPETTYEAAKSEINTFKIEFVDSNTEKNESQVTSDDDETYDDGGQMYADDDSPDTSYQESISTNFDEKLDPNFSPTMAKSIPKKSSVTKRNISLEDSSMMQYTVSNRGRLQMILNRYVYYLKYSTSEKKDKKQWRCVDYINRVKCPAYLVTKSNVVVKRIAMHTHPCHDYKIQKKVMRNAIFSTIQEAEQYSQK